MTTIVNLGPCACCQAGCSCPGCACCQCGTWQQFFDYYATYPYGWGGPKGYWLRPDVNLSLYDGLERAGVCNLTRLYESKAACVTACQASLAPWGGEPYPGFCAEDGGPCGDVYIFGGGWSAPRINGTLATPELLQSLCPAGSPPPDFADDGYTRFYGVPEFDTLCAPDIARLVFKPGQSTGDPIADALFERGTRHDLPDSGWTETADCGTCDTPPVLAFDCDPASGRFYTKTVDWEWSFGSKIADCASPPINPYTGLVVDPLGFCPPQRCKVVTIKVTRTEKCDPTSWSTTVNFPIVTLQPDRSCSPEIKATQTVTVAPGVSLPATATVTWAADDDIAINGVRLDGGCTASSGTTTVVITTPSITVDLIDTVGVNWGGSVTITIGTPPVVTEWRAIVYVCPCVTMAFMGVDPDTGDLWAAAYGYNSEAECTADLGAPSCTGNQWQQVRHEDCDGDRYLTSYSCCPVGGYGGFCE